MGALINRNPQEKTGDFNTLRVRDWLVFRLLDNVNNFYPLKIRSSRLWKNEIIYAIGWSHYQEGSDPSVIKMQVFQNLGPYVYIKTITKNTDPAGRSGSPVIDENGHLVGLVSGAEGNLGIVATTQYLEQELVNAGYPLTE